MLTYCLVTKFSADKGACYFTFQHKYDRSGKAKDIGDKAVVLIEKMADIRSYKVTKASKKEDCKDHFDYRFAKNGKELKIEVKAMKRVSRSQDDGQDEWIWIEFKNVAGDLGWVYGKADYVAFELQDSFIFVDRKGLAKLSEKIVDFNDIVKSPFEARRKCYRRKNRPDELVAMIHINDIVSSSEVKYHVWKKP